MKLRVLDIHKQEWNVEVNENRACSYYISLKNVHECEKYLVELWYKSRCIISQFRSRSNYLPIHISKFHEVDPEDISCPFCDSMNAGDESHYLLNCPYFTDYRESLINDNVCLDVNLYDSIENLKKCIPFMEHIMFECKDILTCL